MATSAGTGKKSEIWKFFTRKGNGICQCNLCGKNYKTGGGTTNMKNHIKHKHPFSIKSAEQVAVPVPNNDTDEDYEETEESDLSTETFESSSRPSSSTQLNDSREGSEASEVRKSTHFQACCIIYYYIHR